MSTWSRALVTAQRDGDKGLLLKNSFVDNRQSYLTQTLLDADLGGDLVFHVRNCDERHQSA